MKRIALCIFLLLKTLMYSQKTDSAMLRGFYDYFLTESHCYSNLSHLSNNIGGRLSGSPQAAEAVQWAKKAMYQAGADTVILQPCMVPHWVRGNKEQCLLNSGKKKKPLACTALGGSAGTGNKLLTAPVIMVSSFEELEKLGRQKVEGKIVFYNVFFDRRHVNTGHAYGETVKYRGRGASFAARYGALACLVRSMTSAEDDEPHTGNMAYDTTLSASKIPALALGYQSANLLQGALSQGGEVSISIKTSCRTLEPVLSYNVVGQLNGAKEPNTFITVGGHLDSWDNGDGAHDDGAGVVQAMEVLAAFRKLGVKPQRSIRAVAFMNEENGLAGGSAYADFARSKDENHLTAIESDAGGFTPRGFNADTAHGLFGKVESWKKLFAPYFIDRFEEGGGGADLIALEQRLGVPCMGFIPDSQRYFDIHHTAADTFDKVNRRELELGGAAITSLVYLLDKFYKW